MHRSHDREALNESRAEPEPALGSGSSPSAEPAPEDGAELHLLLRQRQHDAANWLAVLRGHLDLLAHDPDAAPTLRAEWLDRARSAAAGAERLLRGAGDPVAAGGTHSPLSVVLQDLAGHGHTILPGYAQLRLEIDLSHEQRCVLADDDLEDVLLNLLRNGGQALHERGGTITLRAREAGAGEVALEVEDDGSGMTPEVRDRCLAPGFTTRKGEGRGLGLSRVHAIVRAAGGRIEIDSESGKGTCMRLILAAFPEDGGTTDAAASGSVEVPSTEQRDAKRSVAIPGGVPRVLVVDDDADVREVLLAMLDRLGAHAVAAADAQACRARMRELSFDLVLVDRELPDLDGDALAREIRQGDPALAIVLLTGDPRGGRAGEIFDEVLVKPVGLDRLRELFEHVLPFTRRRGAEASDA